MPCLLFNLYHNEIMYSYKIIILLFHNSYAVLCNDALLIAQANS